MTTWDDVKAAVAALDLALAEYDANPCDRTAIAWESAQAALDETVRAYKTARAEGGERQ